MCSGEIIQIMPEWPWVSHAGRWKMKYTWRIVDWKFQWKCATHLHLFHLILRSFREFFLKTFPDKWNLVSAQQRKECGSRKVEEFVGGEQKVKQKLIFSIRNRNLQSAWHLNSDLTSFGSFRFFVFVVCHYPSYWKVFRIWRFKIKEEFVN